MLCTGFEVYLEYYWDLKAPKELFNGILINALRVVEYSITSYIRPAGTRSYSRMQPIVELNV